MLDYLTALTMLLLVIGHALLIMKCTKLTNEIEPSAGKLSGEMSDITGLLNELCDIIHEATNSLIPKAAQNAQTGFDLPSLLTNLLMPKPPLPVDEGERIWQEIENPAGIHEKQQQEQDEENLQPI